MTKGNDILNPHYVDYGHDDRGYTHDGLSKREYFAAMRKEPIFGSGDTLSEVWAKLLMKSDTVPKYGTIENVQWWCEAHERFAVMKADALIKALNETE